MYVTNTNGEKVFGPTEHIIQLAISIDDGKIIAGVEEAARKQIINSLQNELMLAVFNPKYYGYGSDEIDVTNPREWVRLQFGLFLENHKDEIIGAAAKQLADKLVRSKAGKALLDQK